MPDRAGCAFVRIDTSDGSAISPRSPLHAPDVASLEELSADIRGARAAAQLVIVALHKGIVHTPARLAPYERTVAQAAIDAGALSSEKLVRLYLNRIAAYDQKGPALNSILVTNEKALAMARALDAERKAKGRRSPLHGIPIIAKDLVNTADMQTTGGFIVMKGAVPANDANVIKRLRDAGAVIFAKTNMSEWLGRSRGDGGCSIAGQVVNPYDLTRTVAD